MIITTTQTVEGRSVSEYLGIVTGGDYQQIAGLIGEGLLLFSSNLNTTTNTALKKMTEKASELGADAVIGVQVSISAGEKNGGQLYIGTSGTAVKLTDSDSSFSLPDL